MSKKIKKPKIHLVSILKSSEIENYIRLKFEAENNKFWDWFFSESSYGDVNLLSLDSNDINIIQLQFMDYFNIIKNEFKLDVNEDNCLEIENDF